MPRTLLLACGLLLPACMAPLDDGPPPPKIWELRGDLDPLKNAFNEHKEWPRMVALLPPSCAATRKSLQHAQAEVEALKNGDQVLWMIVWQDELPSDDLSAARQACGPVADEHTFYFYDNEWLAGRSFADGTVLTGHLTRAFLFYPPGTLWGEQPPEPSAWVHSMGRVGTANRGDADRLTEALRWQWNLLARPR